MNTQAIASKHSTHDLSLELIPFQRQVLDLDFSKRGIVESIRKLSISSVPRVSQECRFFAKNKPLKFQAVLLERYSKNRLFALKPVAYRIPCKDPATTANTDCSSGVCSALFRVSEQKISSNSSLQNEKKPLDHLNEIDETPAHILHNWTRSDKTIPVLRSESQSPKTLSIRHQQSEGQLKSKGLVLKRTNSINSLHMYLNSKIEKPIQLNMDQFRRLMTDKQDSQGGIKPILKNSKTSSPAKQMIDCTARTSQKTMDCGRGSETSKSLKKKVSFSKNRIVKLYNPQLSQDFEDRPIYSKKGFL